MIWFHWIISIKKAVMFEENDLNDIVHTVLQCLSHISEKRYYGINVLADVLRGANSKRITAAELNKLPEYGKLKKSVAMI